MDSVALDLDGPEDLVAELHQRAAEMGLETSQVTSPASASDALDAPISAEPVVLDERAITILVTSETIDKWLDLLQHLFERVGAKSQLSVHDSLTREVRGQLSASTTPSTARRILGL